MKPSPGEGFSNRSLLNISAWTMGLDLSAYSWQNGKKEIKKKDRGWFRSPNKKRCNVKLKLVSCHWAEVCHCGFQIFDKLYRNKRKKIKSYLLTCCLIVWFICHFNLHTSQKFAFALWRQKNDTTDSTRSPLTSVARLLPNKWSNPQIDLENITKMENAVLYNSSGCHRGQKYPTVTSCDVRTFYIRNAEASTRPLFLAAQQ